MSSTESSQDIQRILVALDASPQSTAALEAAAELAARFEAELIGIFIEDVNLLRMAQLPFTREISYYSASLRQLDKPQIERQLRARARSVQRAIARVSESAHLRWSFRVARGVVPIELVAAGMEADLIVLGKTGWSGRKRVGSTTRLMIFQSPRQTLILQRRVHLRSPIVVIYDGSEAGQKALSAARVVWSEGNPLTILIMAGEPEKAQRLQTEAKEQLQQLGLEAQFSWRKDLDGRMIARLAMAEGCGVLVLPVESEQLPAEVLLNVLNETECGILFVR